VSRFNLSGKCGGGVDRSTHVENGFNSNHVGRKIVGLTGKIYMLYYYLPV
jgi:hypothetical protein